VFSIAADKYRWTQITAASPLLGFYLTAKEYLAHSRQDEEFIRLSHSVMAF